DAHFDWYGDRLSAGQLDALALERRESRQRGCQNVDAGAQIDDAVLARSIGDRGPRLLDEDGARGLDRHAWQDSARRVANGAGQRSLRQDRRRQQQERENRQKLRNSHSQLQTPYRAGWRRIRTQLQWC